MIKSICSLGVKLARLTVFILMALSLANCASNKSAPPEATPQSSTSALQSAAFDEVVKGLYAAILGRQPTAAELANAIALLQAGLTSTGLQQQLATSVESIYNITSHLVANGFSGMNLQTTIDQWVAQLANGKSLQQLLAGN
ncbi:MAG: hypothetical protein ACXVA9_10260 [Bdellovibrionales bacterium]